MKQACPNCAAENDTGVYVSGQRHRCVSCAISFEVVRTDVMTTPARGQSDSVTDTDGLRLDATFVHAPSSAPAANGPSTSPHANEVELPGYRLVEVLGRGGMGEVWRAEQVSLGRPVAVKLLPSKLASDREFVARFSKESTALAALSHPNVIQIIDRGQVKDHYYFVMEYVQGRSLRELMNGGKLPFPQALRVATQICRAMDYAHDQRIIHRDLKPENILLDDRGHVKVADFGLAGMDRKDSDALKLTATAVAMGTVNYMAPEQRRDAKHVDGRADLYSMGVIFYEMLTGELPLGRFRLPSERVEGLDPRIDPIVAKLLESDPALRYARAAECLEALEPLLTATSSAGPISLPGTVTDPPSPAKAALRTLSSPRVLVATGWKTVRTAITGLGILAVLGLGIRLAGGTARVGSHGVDLQMGAARIEVPLPGRGGSQDYPPNTDAEINASSDYSMDAHGLASLAMRFVPGGNEAIHAHAGSWALTDGKLEVLQAGEETTGTGPLIPRAYIDDRFFTTDALSAEVELRMGDLDKGRYRLEPDAQRFGELAFQLRDVQVSAFADPATGMRVAWRYTNRDGDQRGSSVADIQAGLADVVPVPADRTFTLKLVLKDTPAGTKMLAYVDDQVFAGHLLKGLHNRPVKIALGCRNMHCWFDSLKVQGKVAAVTLASTGEEHGEQ